MDKIALILQQHILTAISRMIKITHFPIPKILNLKS